MNKNILKWAGSKSRLMPELLTQLPKSDFLIEPFAGSASVFMNTNYKGYVLADSNIDLMNLYKVAVADTAELICMAKKIFEDWTDEKSFYAARDYFNQKSERMADNSLMQATYFLYLNRHCYNGLCRYNQKGEFNAPYGKFKSVYFPENEIILFAEKVRNTNTLLIEGDFKKTIQQHATANAVIYCDPPYLPVSKTSNFSQYNAAPFGANQHQELVAALIDAQRRHGVKAVISGSDTEETRRIYSSFDLKSVNVHRSVSANSAKRGNTAEVIGTLKICEDCGGAGGGCCPDCGPAMGDATYKATADAGVFDEE
ncbi:DNA adenine methylase [Pantoea sp. y20]